MSLLTMLLFPLSRFWISFIVPDFGWSYFHSSYKAITPCVAAAAAAADDDVDDDDDDDVDDKAIIDVQTNCVPCITK